MGSNIGYNSITLAQQYGCSVTGLEYNPRNIEKAEMLAGLSSVKLDFVQGDAVTYVQKDEYDLVLHLGTLYHLPDPVLALKNTALCLKKGGKLYIESAVYQNDDSYACRFLHGFGGDRTNYWALSPFVIEQILVEAGMKNFELLHDIQIRAYEGTGMSRAVFYAEK